MKNEDNEEFTIEHLEAKKPKQKKAAKKGKKKGKGAISDQDKAFLMSQAKTLSFGGREGGEIELYPFDTYRQTAAQNMGMKAFNLSEDAVMEFQETGTYNGILLDAILVIYLCTQPENTALRALSVPTGIRQQSMHWANSNGIVVGSQNHAELAEKFGEIIGEIFASHSSPQDNGSDEGDSLGE